MQSLVQDLNSGRRVQDLNSDRHVQDLNSGRRVPIPKTVIITLQKPP